MIILGVKLRPPKSSSQTKGREVRIDDAATTLTRAMSSHLACITFLGLAMHPARKVLEAWNADLVPSSVLPKRGGYRYDVFYGSMVVSVVCWR